MDMNDEALVLKEKGNACVKENKFEEAVLHYSNAIKLDPDNSSLYSNRSLAFFKLQHYYQAHEDASECIRLRPDWAKGYYRKGEVLSAVYQFSDALLSYRIALQLVPNDPVITEAIKKTTLQLCKDKKADQQIPWVGAGVGIIIGVIIVIGDQLTAKPTISHPILMALVAIVIGLIGFGAAKGYRHYTWCQRKAMLDPPLDLLQEMRKKNGYVDDINNGEEKIGENKQRKHTTKAQSRLKLRKSKV